MSLEVAIRENTEAVTELTELLSKLLLTGLIKPEPKKVEQKVAKVKETAVADDVKPEIKLEISAQANELTYADVKEMVRKLAVTHLADIKELLTAHKIGRLSDLLINPDDAEAGVKDTVALAAIGIKLQTMSNG